MKPIETYVQELATLQAELAATKIAANEASKEIDAEIAEEEMALRHLRGIRERIRQPHEYEINEIGIRIATMQECIVETWDGEKKTLKFDAGTLKFRTTQSLNIKDESWLLASLLDHTSLEDVATRYISGFNKTAVKKYMGVIGMPDGAAELISKTTVKLEG